MAAVPGSLMSPPRVSLQMAPPAIHSVLLVSNLNPEVRGHTQKPGVKLTLLTTFVSAERLASLPLHLIWWESLTCRLSVWESSTSKPLPCALMSSQVFTGTFREWRSSSTRRKTLWSRWAMLPRLSLVRQFFHTKTRFLHCGILIGRLPVSVSHNRKLFCYVFFLLNFSSQQRWVIWTASVSTVTWFEWCCPNIQWCSCLAEGRAKRSRRWHGTSQAPPSTASKSPDPKTSTTSSLRRPRCTSPTSRKTRVHVLKHTTVHLSSSNTPSPPPCVLVPQLFCQWGRLEGSVLLQRILSEGLQVFPVSPRLRDESDREALIPMLTPLLTLMHSCSLKCVLTHLTSVGGDVTLA